MAEPAQTRPRQAQQPVTSSAFRIMFSRMAIMAVVWLAVNITRVFKAGKDVSPLTAETWPQFIADHPYQGKGPVENRSPCPMLNTLANHGIINNSGKDITKKEFMDALTKLNLGPQFGALFVEGVFWLYHEKKSLPHWFGQLNTLDLAQLQTHNSIEHDVSYTRTDYDVQKDAGADSKLVFQLSQFANETGYLDLAAAGQARHLRQLQSIRDNSDLNFNFFYQFVGSGSECALLLNVLGRNMSISVDHLNTFFNEERFPDDWTPPEETFSAFKLAKATFQCYQSWKNSPITLEKEQEILAAYQKARLVKQD